MKEFFKDIYQDKTITFAFFINTFFIAATAVFILVTYGRLPPFIPIFNQLPWGQERLGKTITVFVPVLVSLLILVINLFTASAIYKKIPLIARMLAAVSLLASILTFLFVVKTIILII